VLGAQELTEVLIVHIDLNLISESFKVVALGFEYFNDGKELTIIHIIVVLSSYHLPGEESNKPPIIVQN
jgi:hypothetical protein